MVTSTLIFSLRTYGIKKTMGVVVKQSIQSVIITLVGVVLGLAINLLSMRYFSKVEFGFNQNLARIATIISYVSILGFNYALTIKSQQYTHPHPKRGAFLGIAAIIPFITTIITFILYFVFKEDIINFYKGENSELVARYFSLFPIFTLFVSVSAWLEAYHQSINQNAVQSFSREVLSRIYHITLIFTYGFGLISFNTFIIAFTATFLLPILYMLWKAYRSGTFYFKPNKGQFSFKEIKELTVFSGYQTFVVLAIFLIQQIDVILLGGLDENGFQSIAVYSIAAFAINAIRNPLRAISNAALPTITRLFNEGEWNSLDEKYKKIAASMLLGAVTMSLLMICNLSGILAILNKIAIGYNAVIILIPILLLGCVIEQGLGMTLELISISKYFRFNLLATVIMLICIIGINFILIDEYGLFGAAWATTIGVIGYGLLKAGFVWAKFKLLPFSTATWKILVLGAFIYGVLYIIPQIGNVYIDIALRSSLIGLLLATGTYFLNITEETTRIITKVLVKLRLKQ